MRIVRYSYRKQRKPATLAAGIVLAAIIAKGKNARQAVPVAEPMNYSRVGVGSGDQRMTRGDDQGKIMAEIVNLNKVRKSKARVEGDSQARANRVKYGRTKAEKASDQRAEERRESQHEGTKLED